MASMTQRFEWRDQPFSAAAICGSTFARWLTHRWLDDCVLPVCGERSEADAGRTGASIHRANSSIMIMIINMMTTPNNDA